MAYLHLNSFVTDIVSFLKVLLHNFVVEYLISNLLMMLMEQNNRG